jgi:putative ABC transport system permease protein
MTGFLQDIRYALRTLRKSPGYAAVALATLALGIGANTAVFSVLDAVLLRPLPYADAGRLTMIGDRNPDGGSPYNLGFATYEDLRDQSRSFAAVAAIRQWQPTLVTGGVAESLTAMRVTANYFSMLGVRPVLGRDFLPEDDRPDSWQVLLLSDGLWRRSFGADPSVVGRVVRMSGQSYRILGVMPPESQLLVSSSFFRGAQLWAPIGYDRSLPQACRSCQHLKAVGRLAPGVTVAQARSDLDGVRRRLVQEHPEDYSAGAMDVVPLARELTWSLRAPFFVLVGSVAFVLLIACANVAKLTLARSLGRGHEMAIRGALGASRGRLVRQLFAESLVLCAAGGALGVGLAAALQTALLRLAPVSLPRVSEASFDARVLVFAVLASLASAFLSGVLPALRVSAARATASLASETRASSGPASARARRALTIVELGLAVMLVTGAFLMIRSMARLLDTPVGFDTERVMSLALSLSGEAYAEDAGAVAFQDRALERLRALPGVESAAFAGQIPLGGNGDSYGFHIFGHMAANPAEDPSVERYSVTPDYFRTMGIPLVRGRAFTAEDRVDSPAVLIVSETTARAHFPGRDPIGERARIGGHEEGPWRTIVGIVGDVRHADVALRATPQMYLPQAQMTDGGLVLVVRTRTDSPENLTESIRRVIHEIDPGIPTYDVASMRALVDRSAAPRRFVMRLLAAFAAAALALAAIGLYGVVAHSVGERTREIGIRVALGATPKDVIRLVLSGGAAMVGLGVAVGLLGALGASRFLRGILYEVNPTDPASLVTAVVVLAIVALLAHWLPARRAARVDPVTALRSE